jgi:DNA polymerase III delta subunit
MKKPEQLEQELERQGPASVYLLAGPAEYLVERLVRRVVAASQSRRISVDARLEGPEEVVAMHLGADLFGTARCVVAEHAEAWQPNARKKLLERAAEGLPPGVRLVLTMDSKRPSSAKLPPAVQAAFFWKPFPSALPRLAEAFLRDHGARPARGVSEGLVERYGDDLRRIDQEAFKLAAASKKPDVELLRRLCVPTSDQRGFRVAETLTSRRRKRALGEVEELMRSEGPHALVAVLANRLRRIRWVHELSRRDPGAARRSREAADELVRAEERARNGGFGMKATRRKALEEEVGELLEALTPEEKDDFGKVHPRGLPGIVADADRYRPEELREALRAVAAADRRLKGEAGDQSLVATELVMALTE